MAQRRNHMRERYGDKNGSFEQDLSRFANNALASFEQLFTDVVIQVGEIIVNFSPVDTGRFRANWRFSVERPNTAVDWEDYDKEGDNKIAELVAFANTLTAGQKVFIANSLPYAIPLEYGHSKKAPRGMVRVTLAQFEQIVNTAAAKYNR